MRAAVRRLAPLSVPASPLDQPGTGDAGGMNVYILELARRLAARDIEVEVFTRATSSEQPSVMEAQPGVLVRHIPAGPYEGLSKADRPPPPAPPEQPSVREARPGVLARPIPAGPYEGLSKADLPAQLCTFVREVLR